MLFSSHTLEEVFLCRYSLNLPVPLRRGNWLKLKSLCGIYLYVPSQSQRFVVFVAVANRFGERTHFFLPNSRVPRRTQFNPDPNQLSSDETAGPTNTTVESAVNAQPQNKGESHCAIRTTSPLHNPDPQTESQSYFLAAPTQRSIADERCQTSKRTRTWRLACRVD
uniref:(northern house mosquito) hypothetical protein n=1 Tax=Culex pipiens TaxID=7175 RepID=A0A8D8P5Q3_CULPI